MEKVRDGKLSLDITITLHASEKVGGAGILCGYANGSVLSLDTVLRLMITESDNTATNLVIDLLGMDDINAYIQRTTLRIRKAAYILQVFVSPGLLEFYVLVLFHLCI